MPQKSFAQGRLRHLLPFARKVKAALSLPLDNPNKHQRDELDDNAGLAIVHQKPISTIEAGQQQSLVGNFLEGGRKKIKTTVAVTNVNQQTSTSVSTAAVQCRSSLVLDDLTLTTSTVSATPSKSPKARAASERTPW